MGNDKKNGKESYAHVFREIFCLKTIFARECIPFEKINNLLVRLANSLFVYNNEACKHGKAHLIHKNKQVLSIL